MTIRAYQTSRRGHLVHKSIRNARRRESIMHQILFLYPTRCAYYKFEKQR